VTVFSNGDYLTEKIAHFIGHFEIAEEAARLRQQPEGFDKAGQDAVGRPLEGPTPVPFVAEDVDVGYVPGVDHAPQQNRSDLVFEGEPFQFDPPIITVPSMRIGAPAPGEADIDGVWQAPHTLQAGMPPPSLIFVAQQHKFLFDNDVVVIGEGYDGPFPTTPNSLASVDALSAKVAEVLAPLAELSLEMNEQNIAPWVKSTSSAADSVEEATASGETLEGQWVNGESAETVPELVDHLPKAWQDPETDTPTTSDPIIIDASEAQTTMDLQTGGNLSLNQATIINAGLVGTTMAVEGNVYELDVIMQVNAVQDIDTIDEGFAVLPGADMETTATNVAQFIKNTTDIASERADLNPETMPSGWQVTIVEDDLIFFEWACQYNLTWDNDCLVATATGTTTFVSTGANAGFNAVSFSDLGAMYDLIMVGGNLYDANYICQTNIVYDNDTLSMFGSSFDQAGSTTTGGNVLWNQALIQNMGAADWNHDLPAHYQQAMDTLDAGNAAMPGGFATDSGFAGYGDLNVLYVKGNIFDINYVEQVNIISDADHVALYGAELAQSAEWTIATGTNTAVNVAAILDHDSNGSVSYVGGEVYSQALLIQADFVETGAGELTGEAPLANEVIAFLTDDDLSASDMPAIDNVGALESGPIVDVMDSILA
jgi:hypothetical protein